jgi:putative oxygen-independent coproporphyrinogen III oxidase
MTIEDWRNGGFGIYIHWPFCQSKCPYCDFNSHVATEIDEKRWQAAYLTEIGRETPGRVLETVFFGGGTPSLMSADLVAAILAKIRETWPMVNDPEITLEANPGSVEAARFTSYRSAGVTRVSIGIQALDDSALRKLGRMHTVAEARRAYDIARRTFDRVSFDLIYARQGQGLAEWSVELREALSMEPTHLSLYQLTIEDGTVFAARHRLGQLKGLPDQDLAADLYTETQDICAAAELPAYEVSNHARIGQESRHNQIYWRGGDYIGIGPGAHGRISLGGTRFATEAPKLPTIWLKQVEAGRGGELERVGLTGEDRASEYLLMSLRLLEGMDLARYAAFANRQIDAAKIISLQDLGLLEPTNTHLRATSQGRLLLNAVLRELSA